MIKNDLDKFYAVCSMHLSCMPAGLPFFCCLYSTIPNKSLQGRDFAKSFFGKSLDFSGVFVLEYLLQSMQQAEVLELADRHV